MDFDMDKIARSPWAAGALGSLVALRFAPGMTWGGRAFNVLCGALCAGFLAPPLVEWLALHTDGMRAGAAFAVGMFGLSIAAAAAEAVRNVAWGDVVRGWVTRRQGPGERKE